MDSRCWLPLLLVFCVSGLWCHPVPEKSNTSDGAVSPLRAQELGQPSDLADNDYPEMMTDFLRLTTTTPTVASSTKNSNNSAATTNATQKPFEIATAKFSPTLATTTTTTAKPTTPSTTSLPQVKNVTPDSETTATVEPESVTTEQVTATPPAKSKQPTVTAQQTGLALNPAKQQKVIPNQKKQMSVQKTATAAVQQQQQPPVPTIPMVQQPFALNDIPQQQPTPIFPSQVQNPAQQPTVSNQPQQQQQQMAVSTTAQQPFTAASNGPRQPIFVPVPNQQQANPAMVQQPMMMANPVMAQQPMPMPNPAMIQQQQQLQMMQNPYQQRLLQQAQANLLANSNKQKGTVTNQQRWGSAGRPVFIRGGNGTPTHLIPLAAWPQYIQSIPSNGIQMIPPTATA